MGMVRSRPQDTILPVDRPLPRVMVWGGEGSGGASGGHCRFPDRREGLRLGRFACFFHKRGCMSKGARREQPIRVGLYDAPFSTVASGWCCTAQMRGRAEPIIGACYARVMARRPNRRGPNQGRKASGLPSSLPSSTFWTLGLGKSAHGKHPRPSFGDMVQPEGSESSDLAVHVRGNMVSHIVAFKSVAPWVLFFWSWPPGL